ncbi:hypothetical protein A1O7_06652 [Cladophialophora yegresii CBS 114405]|uniref:C6 zinc finger domain-containing protein n=1 Tax=Cladophialophora yegresii CBS 114405 TaxID=1182544 RepID=W9W2J1_9EURO|nr:uncharacterized protein A1O7_06652 [Cladophialophora yegresii CBS 114405]EXJ59220.1 hypothetical protein A1O7_06652 [Cladophialophora yegresii CBS 114405]
MVIVQPGKKQHTMVVRASSPGSSVSTISRDTSTEPRFVGLLPSLLGTAFRSQTYECFITDYAPHSTETWAGLPTNLSIIPATSWLQAAIAVAPTDPVLNNALTAMALAQVGRMTRRPDLLLVGRKLYTEALSGLNRRLKGGDECFTDTTIAAMQEGSSEGRSKSWQSHVKGASALIQLRGRANFSTPLSNRVFLGAQIAEFIASVGSRKPSANASLWSQACQSTTTDPSFISPLRLFEILHTLPAIMRDAENISPVYIAEERTADSVSDALVSVMQNCHDFETRLTEWYNDLEARYQNDHRGIRPQPNAPLFIDETETTVESKLYWFEPSTLYSRLPRNSAARIFPFFICFPNPDIAFQIMLHWTGLLLMHITLHLTRSRFGQARPGISLPVIGQFKFTNDARSLALLIAQSLEYFVHPDMGLLGTNLIGFPLSSAQRYFQHAGTKEQLWFDVIFQRIGEMKSGLRGFLDDMAQRRTVKLVSPWHRTSLK